MNPERLAIEFMIAGEILNPYAARITTNTLLHGSYSLDKPILKPERSGELSTLADLIPSNAQSVEETVERKIFREQVLALSESSGLTDDQKLAFDLLFKSGWSYGEIAQYLGHKHRSKVQQWIKSAIKKMRRNPDFSKLEGWQTA